MADTRDIDLEAILKRVEFLEKENHSLREEVEILKSNDDEIRAELNIINRFISALTECQSIDEVMTEIESASKQLTTGSGKAAELLMKTRYFDELTGGKGMVFASGTPIITGYLRSEMPILRCL